MHMRRFIDLIENDIDESGAGPARIAQHIRNGEKFIMLSGMRGDLDHATNIRRSRELKNKLARSPVSFIETFGEYHEIGQDEPSPEMSFFIMPTRRGNEISSNAFLKLGISIMNAYDQDAIVFGDGANIMLVERDGNWIDLGKTATFDPSIIQTLPGFSKVKDRAFSFTDIEPPRAVKYGSSRPNDLTKSRTAA